MMAFALLALTSLLFDRCNSASVYWEYDEVGANTSHWKDNFPECGMLRQSPINIPSSAESRCTDPLTLEGIWTENLHFVLRNNRHSLKAIPFAIDHYGGSDITELEVLHHTNDTLIRLKNGFYNTYKSRINSVYCFDSLHFHWGRTNSYGSEHAIDGKHYPLEVHLVHYSCDYGQTSEAIHDYAEGTAAKKYDDTNVLAVIGILFEIDNNSPNPTLQKILDEVESHNIHFYHDPEDISHIDNILELYYTEFNLSDLFPTNTEYVAYEGSLTTPPCFQTVRWHVLTNTMTVSESQMATFRKMLESTKLNDSMAPNWRPLQPLGNRSLYHCKSAVDAINVEKDAVTSTDPQENQQEDDDDDDTWFIVGVIFICLFGIALIVIIYLMYRIHREGAKTVNTDGQQKQYQHAASVDMDLPDNAETQQDYH